MNALCERLGILLLGGLVLGGCTTRLLASHPHRMEKGCSVVADATIIVCDGVEIARVECHRERGRAEPPCRALAVRYLDGDTAWLYRAASFDPEHPERYRAPDKVDVDRAYSPVVAMDGRKVWFYSRGLVDRGSFHVYDVQTGASVEVDRADEWRIWAAVHEGRAVPLGGKVPVDLIP